VEEWSWFTSGIRQKLKNYIVANLATWELVAGFSVLPLSTAMSFRKRPADFMGPSGYSVRVVLDRRCRYASVPLHDRSPSAVCLLDPAT
jgi:hypothetical protein